MNTISDLWRSTRGCCLAIFALALLLLLGACVALGWGVAKWTEAAEELGLDVMLVIDQSGSLWELGGVGTDPELLRMEGARLFAAYLGVDGAAANYRTRCGVFRQPAAPDRSLDAADRARQRPRGAVDGLGRLPTTDGLDRRQRRSGAGLRRALFERASTARSHESHCAVHRWPATDRGAHHPCGHPDLPERAARPNPGLHRSGDCVPHCAVGQRGQRRGSTDTRRLPAAVGWAG